MRKEKYLEIRKVYSKFVYKILNSESNGKIDIIQAGKALGFWDGKQLLFETEEETNVLSDFLLYEKNGKSNRLIDRYNNIKDQNLSLIEDEVLKGMLNNYDSLFEVLEIDQEKSILYLLDLLTEKEYKLKDISFSQTLRKKILIYTRLVPIKKIYMTSGLSFCFNSQKRSKLLMSISKRVSRDNSPSKYKIVNQTLFENVFKKHKEYGIEINYIKHDS